jgi:ACS family pantothenate transporter-like MFS transporter
MFSSNAILSLYLKWTGDYSVELVNYMPMAVSAVGIVGTLVLGWYSDFTRRSWHVGVLTACTAIITGSIMLKPPSDAARFFALYLNGIQYANQTVMFAWANRLTLGDAPKRSLILAAMNTVAVIFYSFWSICFYAADQAPKWTRGSVAMIVSGCFLMLGTFVVRHLETRSRKAEEECGVLGVIEVQGLDPASSLEKNGTESAIQHVKQ